MNISVDGITCNTKEGLIVALQRFEGIANGKRESWDDILMRTPSGEFYVYRDWDGYPLDAPREAFIALLDEAAAREWAKNDNDHFFDPPSDERINIRCNPLLWDEPNEQRSRITVTLTNEVIAELMESSEREGYTMSHLLDNTCREMWRLKSLL